MIWVPRSAVAPVAAAILLTAGCAVSPGADRAGGRDVASVTLTLGTDDLPGRPSSEQIEYFAAQVATMSGGAMQIEPARRPRGPVPEWDQVIARLVVAGELDMALVPTRAWDTEGVTSFRALNAPFLVTTDELVADLITSDIADDMLAGLDQLGITGLSLLPGGLRHPFGTRAPLMGLADYEGTTIRTPRSDTVEAMLQAFGADADDADLDAAVHAGMESGFPEDPDVSWATGNVTFFPKVASLIINRSVFEGLDDEQRQVLARAAEATQAWALETWQTDAQLGAAWCAEGGTIAWAASADLHELEQATGPVYDDLRRDPTTRAMIDRIERRRDELGSDPHPAEPCVGGRGGPPATATTEVGPDTTAQDESVADPSGATTPTTGSSLAAADFHEGVFRYEVTGSELRDLGATDEVGIANNVGVYTWTMADGGYCYSVRREVAASDPGAELCGVYTVAGDQLTIHLPSGVAPTVTWRRTEEGDLQLIARPGANRDPYLFAHAIEPWTRIGDAG